MNKIGIIISREYFSRVKKKSFIIMTILGPIFFAGLMLVPIWLAIQEQAKHFIEVIDETGLIEEEGYFKENQFLHFDYPSLTIEQAHQGFYDTDYTSILYIPKNLLNSRKIVLYFKDHPGNLVQEQIRSRIEDILYENQLKGQGIDVKKVDAAHIPINIITEKQSEKGQSEKTNTGVNMAIGFGSGLLIYIFIFLYGMQVMRGVMEEKTNRIIEVIVSSIKPFQLMMGKIIGIAMVSLTQFILWIVLTAILTTVGQATFLKPYTDAAIPTIQPSMPMIQNNQSANIQQENLNANVEITEIMQGVKNINFAQILFAFLFYFLGGYLLYSAMFAAIGAAVDSEADTQQFMFPITIPLIVSIIAIQFIMQNPGGPLSFWLSIIPFTSPIVMMVRLPFGVPLWEFVLSMTLLVLSFIFMTWLAGKIYRTGILMYGKKITYKELWKWMRYSE
ncbi:MAG: ABC transporter permease [Bacteroidota bacterium]